MERVFKEIEKGWKRLRKGEQNRWREREGVSSGEGRRVGSSEGGRRWRVFWAYNRSNWVTSVKAGTPQPSKVSDAAGMPTFCLKLCSRMHNSAAFCPPMFMWQLNDFLYAAHILLSGFFFSNIDIGYWRYLWGKMSYLWQITKEWFFYSHIKWLHGRSVLPHAVMRLLVLQRKDSRILSPLRTLRAVHDRKF